MMTDSPENPGYRSSETSKVLADAYANMRAADAEFAKLKALQKGVEDLTRLGDDDSDAISDLSECAIVTHGLSPNIVQSAIAVSNLDGRQRRSQMLLRPSCLHAGPEPISRSPVQPPSP